MWWAAVLTEGWGARTLPLPPWSVLPARLMTTAELVTGKMIDAALLLFKGRAITKWLAFSLLPLFIAMYVCQQQPPWLQQKTWEDIERFFVLIPCSWHLYHLVIPKYLLEALQIYLLKHKQTSDSRWLDLNWYGWVGVLGDDEVFQFWFAWIYHLADLGFNCSFKKPIS